MRRRQFIAGLAGALATWPLHGRAKQATEAAIGFLDAGSAADRTYVAAAFRQGLAELLKRNSVTVTEAASVNQLRGKPAEVVIIDLDHCNGPKVPA